MKLMNGKLLLSLNDLLITCHWSFEGWLELAVPTMNNDMHIVDSIIAVGVIVILRTDICCHLEVPAKTALVQSFIFLISDFC